jgi:hypothetical protein
MGHKRNLKQFQLYLRPKQFEELNTLRFQITNEYGVKFPISELIRDAVDQLILKTCDEEYLRSYIGSKGW